MPIDYNKDNGIDTVTERLKDLEKRKRSWEAVKGRQHWLSKIAPKAIRDLEAEIAKVRAEQR